VEVQGQLVVLNWIITVFAYRHLVTFDACTGVNLWSARHQCISLSSLVAFLICQNAGFSKHCGQLSRLMYSQTAYPHLLQVAMFPVSIHGGHSSRSARSCSSSVITRLWFQLIAHAFLSISNIKSQLYPLNIRVAHLQVRLHHVCVQPTVLDYHLQCGWWQHP
jgi:hypothetical protein